MNLYVHWEVKVITGDHDGYCSDAENEEFIAFQRIAYKYRISEEQYIKIRLANDIEKLLMSATMNPIRKFMKRDNNDDYIGGRGNKYLQSGYCELSKKHNLAHERLFEIRGLIKCSLDKPDCEAIELSDEDYWLDKCFMRRNLDYSKYKFLTREFKNHF
jgi:hypothetical protein